jgi:hypothetical protein
MYAQYTPMKKPCATKMTLLATWQTAADVYAKAVADLSRQIGVIPKAEYDKLSHDAENARKRSLDAQANLETHIAEHDCDGDEVAA